MRNNANQYQSKLCIDPNADQCLNFDRHWSPLGNDRGGPAHMQTLYTFLHICKHFTHSVIVTRTLVLFISVFWLHVEWGYWNNKQTMNSHLPKSSMIALFVSVYILYPTFCKCNPSRFVKTYTELAIRGYIKTTHAPTLKICILR